MRVAFVICAAAFAAVGQDDRLLWSWTSTVDGGDEWIDIVVGEGVVYETELWAKVDFPDATRGSLGRLRAFDAATGKELWRSESKVEVTAATAKGIFGTTGKSLMALDGAKDLWKVDVDIPDKHEFDTVNVEGGRLYVRAGTADLDFRPGRQTTAGTLFCMEAASGKMVWKADVGRAHGPDRLTVRGGRVYGMSYDGLVFCLDAANGADVWRKKYGATFVSPDVDADGKRLFIRSNNGKLQALDASDGSVVWTYKGDVSPTQPVQEGTGPVWADGKLVYRLGTGGMRCLSADDGRELWTVSLPQGLTQPGEEPIVSGDRVYVGCQDGSRARVECRELGTGKLVWHWTAKSRNASGRAGQLVLKDKKLWFVAGGRTIFCLRAE